MTTKVPVRQTTGFVFTKPPFQSDPQTLVPAGQLILAHGLGEKPKVLQVQAVCTVATSGYLVGDELEVNPGDNNDSTSVSRGLGVVRTDSTIIIRIGNNDQPFIGYNKDTGARFGLNVNHWKLMVRAYA